MKINFILLSPRLVCPLMLGAVGSPTFAAGTEDPHRGAATQSSIPWSQLGARAGADYKGDGLLMTATANGARLHCAFQRLDGEATSEGLWLVSTVTNAGNNRFQVLATKVTRCTEGVANACEVSKCANSFSL